MRWARAEQALHAQKVPQALPAEMEALNHLLRAQAEAQRKQVTRQQANGGGGFNRAQQDLSTLFDRELARQQQTNYETPKTAEERRDDQSDDTLERVRELARRQEALARQQEDLARERARMDTEEVKRRLERLTREQSELVARRRCWRSSYRTRSAARGRNRRGSGGISLNQGNSARQMGSRVASLPAVHLATVRSHPPCGRHPRTCGMLPATCAAKTPSARREQSARALERLQGVEQALRNTGPDERRRALGDAQLESRQLADRQRQLTESAADASKRNDADARRRTAGEQQRLAEGVEALQKRLRELGASGGDRSERERLDGAARELDDAHAAERMRELARGPQKGADPKQTDAGRELARSLDRLADRLGGSTGKADPEGRRLGDDLSRTRELRERLADLQRQMAELVAREVRARGRSKAMTRSAETQRGRPGKPRMASLEKAAIRRDASVHVSWGP